MNESDGYMHRRIGSERGRGPSVETDFEGRMTLDGRIYRLVELLNPTGWVDEYGQTKGVLEMHPAELGLSAQAVSYGRGAYRSGVPAGFLKTSVPNFDKEQADKLRTRWLERHSGDQKSIAVLNATTDVVPINISPLDMALIESREMSLIDIANAFGVPVYMIGGTRAAARWLERSPPDSDSATAHRCPGVPQHPGQVRSQVPGPRHLIHCQSSLETEPPPRLHGQCGGAAARSAAVVDARLGVGTALPGFRASRCGRTTRSLMPETAVLAKGFVL